MNPRSAVAPPLPVWPSVRRAERQRSASLWVSGRSAGPVAGGRVAVGHEHQEVRDQRRQADAQVDVTAVGQLPGGAGRQLLTGQCQLRQRP